MLSYLMYFLVCLGAESLLGLLVWSLSGHPLPWGAILPMAAVTAFLLKEVVWLMDRVRALEERLQALEGEKED